ncbi:ABC transporter ATP-binding protein [Planctomicrobium sp. SH661]|uniref:ABC transporter ATP-binding protein n=1 Tax=Planctomicrobium sp. SH661 TaxID=3448124 RepID=UPI003F5C2920
MIELHDVTIGSGNFSLTNLSLSLPAQCYAVLMGRTGTGKTTLLETICGLRPVLSGEISLNGRVVTRTSPAERELGYVPQDLALFPTMTVQEHLEFALRLRRVSQAERQARVRELSKLLHLDGLLPRRPRGLSGGEAQRVALGRALSFRPEILLLDEPLSALDEETRSQIQSLLKEVQQATGVTVLHVTHSRDEAGILADQLYLLEDGKVRISKEMPVSED